jgi:hypothetical protein
MTAIDIDATPDRVWEVLSDFSAYPEWNPFIVRANGKAEAGRRITVRMQPVGSRAVTLRPTVLEATEGRRLRWRGRLGIPGIFDVEHVFSIETGDGGRTRLSQSEQFVGVLVPFMSGSLDRHTLPAFAAMNEALKRRAEHAVVAQRG